jgi:hypothetical protein
LGDASYRIELHHGFILTVLKQVQDRLEAPHAGWRPLVATDTRPCPVDGGAIS